MEIQVSLPHSENFGSIDGDLRISDIPMESDDGLLLKWVALCADLLSVNCEVNNID